MRQATCGNILCLRVDMSADTRVDTHVDKSTRKDMGCLVEVWNCIMDVRVLEPGMHQA